MIDLAKEFPELFKALSIWLTARAVYARELKRQMGGDREIDDRLRRAIEALADAEHVLEHAARKVIP